MFMYSGTLTSIIEDQGVYVYNLGENGEALDLVQVFRKENPSYLAVDSQRGRLFAVSRAGGSNRAENGRLVVCEIDRRSGKLAQLGETAVAPEPAYVSVDQTGRCALYASTFSGSVGATSIDEDGRPGPASVIRHEGRSLIEQGFGAKGVQLHRPESTPCHDAQQVETKRSDVSSLGPERPSGRGYASLVSDEAASKHPGPGDGIRLLDPTFARKTALCSMKRALDVVQNNAKCGRKAAQRRHLLTLQKSLAQPMRGRGAATHRLCASRRGVHL